MIKTISIFILILFSGICSGQDYKFKKVSNDSISSINKNPLLQLEIVDGDKFKITGIEGNFKTQKESLKNYILEKKEKANIGIKDKKTIGFDNYQKCFFEVGTIYQEIWNEQAIKLFQKDFKDCSVDQKEKITGTYPIKFH
jgi:hypothetical protein